jgi:predicted exporter
MTWTELSQLLTPVGVLAGVWVSWLNGQKMNRQRDSIAELHRSTNGLSERNEAIAKKLGIEEGKASERANPS